MRSYSERLERLCMEGMFLYKNIYQELFLYQVSHKVSLLCSDMNVNNVCIEKLSADKHKTRS